MVGENILLEIAHIETETTVKHVLETCTCDLVSALPIHAHFFPVKHGV
jgi:hypothetical protein